jgi:hypothetical protein
MASLATLKPKGTLGAQTDALVGQAPLFPGFGREQTTKRETFTSTAGFGNQSSPGPSVLARQP